MILYTTVTIYVLQLSKEKIFSIFDYRSYEKHWHVSCLSVSSVVELKPKARDGRDRSRTASGFRWRVPETVRTPVLQERYLQLPNPWSLWPTAAPNLPVRCPLSRYPRRFSSSTRTSSCSFIRPRRAYRDSCSCSNSSRLSSSCYRLVD